MPRVTLLQTNFTAGELSPKVHGRVDVARYQNGAKTARNVIAEIWGGMRRRDGTRYVNEVKDSTKRVRLIPFIYSETTAYMLEFGDTYMRVYKDGAVLGAPYEISTPFTEAMLDELDYTQGSDTMFIFHESLEPRRLRRFGDTSWTLDVAPFVAAPFVEPGTNPAASLTPSAKDPVGGSVTLTASAGVFVSGDVGKSVKINGGTVLLTGYTSATVVTGTIKVELTSTTAAPADAWSLHALAWTPTNGYPRTGTLFEQRLVVAGSPAYPQTIWGSVTGAYLDFSQGVNDDDAFAFNVASDQVNPIQYITSSRALVAMTSGGEFTVQGGLEKPLAPTNVQVRQRSNYGCSRVRPVRIRDAELFVQRAGRKLRSFAYNVASDDWTAPDVSVLAEHITQGGFVDMCWQQEPTSILWLVKADGMLVSVTYDTDQDVMAWTEHEMVGAAETVATIPSETGDQVWLVVNRTIDGATARYVEMLDAAVLVDSAKVMTAGSAQTVWSGLDHLEGEDVDVVADGAYSGRYTVAGGAVTISAAALTVTVGLPYTSTIELLNPEIQTGMGSAVGNAMRTSEITLRVHETTGGEINGQALVFRRFGDNSLIETPQAYTGVVRVENLGWERGTSPVVITQDKPMPFHVLSVTRKFTTND